MSNIAIAIIVLFLFFWLYSLISVFTSEFVDKKQKVFWVIGIIFVPFLAFFYIFMKKKLLK